LTSDKTHKRAMALLPTVTWMLAAAYL